METKSPIQAVCERVCIKAIVPNTDEKIASLNRKRNLLNVEFNEMSNGENYS